MEKSRGAVLFNNEEKDIKYVLIVNVETGECGIPKGHIEANETDYQTTLREIKEETMIDANIIEGFSKKVEYVMPNGVTKEVIYYIATYQKQVPQHNPEERLDVKLLTYEEAMKQITHENVKEVLKEANEWIINNIK